LNPKVISVPFVAKTGLQSVQGFDYDAATGTVFYANGLDQKLFKWTIGDAQVKSIDVTPPYNASGLNLRGMYRTKF
jgi:hypothetical protein